MIPSKLYLAGAMSKYKDSDWNFGMFNRAAKELRDKGFEVVNPAESFNGDTTLEWSEYLKHDIPQLCSCDAIVLLGFDWQESPGARLESYIATQLGMPTLDVDLNPIDVGKAKLDTFTTKLLGEIKPKPEHWFNQHANEIHAETDSILNERAGEYADSWRDMQFVFMDLSLRMFGAQLNYDQVRLLALAALCDTKLSRMKSGAFKCDNHIDFNNYNAAFTAAMREYTHGV